MYVQLYPTIISIFTGAPEQPIDLEQNLRLLETEDNENDLEGGEGDLTSRPISANLEDSIHEISPPASIPMEISVGSPSGEARRQRKPSDVSEVSGRQPYGATRVSFKIPVKGSTSRSNLLVESRWPSRPTSPDPSREFQRQDSEIGGLSKPFQSPRESRHFSVIVPGTNSLEMERQERQRHSDATPMKRIPGYKNDFVARIRSEPYGHLLDAANLDRLDSSKVTLTSNVEKAILGIRRSGNMEGLSPAHSHGNNLRSSPQTPLRLHSFGLPSDMDWDGPGIPRVMSVPNQIVSL